MKAPKFPTDRIFETDTDNKACGEYQVIDAEKMQVRHIQDHELSKCNGVFGFSTSDTPKVMRWVPKIQKYVKEHCE